MLTLARSLARRGDDTLEAVIVGENGEGLLGMLASYGVSAVHLARHPGLGAYAPQAWARCLAQLVTTLQPQVLLAGGSDRGNELMAHVAAQARLPFAANCIEIRPGEPYTVIRLRWGGSLFEEASLSGSTKIITVAPHTIAAEPEERVAGAVTVHEVTPTLVDADFRVRFIGRTETEAGTISLSDARVVVGGGRGVGSAEGFNTLQKLADLVGGAVGSSRAATNLGWRAHADQIGQTGTRIAPDVYIACGISGAIQHMVGCKGSKQILAINIDREAPIVAKADYAVIGDLHQVIPALVAEIEKLGEN
jgi:electron transfer flavoprotein alpha subunit